jgi:hypothetical protein
MIYDTTHRIYMRERQADIPKFIVILKTFEWNAVQRPTLFREETNRIR